jgi:hypothetical protein
MAITAQLFDGTILEFPDGTDESVIQRTVQNVTEEKQVKSDTGFTGAFKAGKERLKGDIAALAGRTGIMDTEAAEQYKAQKERLAGRMFTPTEEGFAEAPFTKFKELLGGSLPYAAAPLAAGVAAATLPVSAPVATGIGLTGAGLASLAQFTGSNLSRQMQEDPNLRLADTSLSSAAAAAAPQAALDVVSFRMMPGIGKIFGAAGKEITPEIAQKIAEQGILRTTGAYGAGALKTAGIEGTTEAGQQFLERLQAGLNLTDPQARDEYFDSFIGGAVLGGTLGVPGTYLERGRTIRQGAEMEEEQKRQAIVDRQNAQREAALAQKQQLEQTAQNLGVKSTLALPAPEQRIEMPEVVDPLIDPLGRFKSTDLSAKEVAEINKRRLEMGKPRIGRTFSIEDLADVFKPEEAVAAEGVLNRLIASRTGYTADQNIPAQTLTAAAQQRGIDTTTQGFRDFLIRTTGTDNIDAMSAPQRLAVAQAIQNVKPGDETRILEAGLTNAKYYTPEQYNDTLRGLSKEFKEMGDQENGVSSVLKLIEKYSGLKQEKDQRRILDQAVKDGLLERNVKLSSTGSTIETFKPATDMQPLPGGMDIRKETFKQGEVPESYELRSGARVLTSRETQEEANRDAAAFEQSRQAEIVRLEKEVQKLQKAVAARNAELTQMQALGQDQTNEFFIKSANYYGQDQVANGTIADLRQQQQGFADPVQIVPVGTKPVAKDSFTFYEKNKPQVRFDTEEQAEQYGISRLNDKTLQQIVDAAASQKQTGRVKRYADLAQKELNERQSIEPARGIAITTTKGLKGSKERLESLGIYSKEVQDNLEKLRQSLLPSLKRFGLEKVALRVLDSIENGTADGYYVKQVMAIAMDSKDPMGTLRHESIHALKELGAFTDQEWKVLTNKAKSEWVQKFIKDKNLYDAYKDRYQTDNGNLSGFDEYIYEEAIAEAFRNFKPGNLPAGMIGNIWVRLNKLLEALRNAFQKLGFQTTDDIFTRIEEGEQKPTKDVVAEKTKLAIRAPKTEEFKKWFGNSKVVDKNGNPVVVYHGTDSNFKKFNTEEGAFFFGGWEAASFAQTYGENVIPAYVRITNPLKASFEEFISYDIDDLKSKGYDGVVYETEVEGMPDEITQQWVAFEPNQIKSASNQKPTESPDIRYSLKETEQFSKDAVQTNNWKATPIAKSMAEDYAVENDITPYLSEGQISVPVDLVKYSIKPPSDDSSKNDPTTGLFLNKNGSVTLYYPTTAAEARRINNEKKIVPSNPKISSIYLTNESSGWKSLGRMGDEYQVTDGSVVRVEIDPSLLQIAQEYEDGRKEFYVPVKEGEYFNKKMRMWAMYAERSKPIPLATKYSELGTAFERSLNAFKQLNEAQKRARTKEVRDILKREHNIGKLLGENGKLEKTRVGDYGITYDDKSVASLGLGLASAQKLNDKTSTCPVSAICEGLCLGDTSGNNMMYGGMASGELAKSLEKTSFRAGPRLSQYLKTEAMMVHPEEFVLLLDKEIKAFKRWADKNEYLPAIRLNVTSDIPPKYLKPIMDANPEVIFYDYTKLDSSPVADNHHLTYSSTGVSQIVNGDQVINKEQNWDRMKRLLDKGSNVAMAFTSKSDMPSVVVDEASGKEYQVWNGDNYDARFLDPKRDDGVGMIVGLTNKAATLKAPTAAKETNGFFIDYDKARDGDRVVIPDQSKFAGSKVIPITKIAVEPKKLSIRPPDTKEFKEFFADTKIVDEEGDPELYYHGTARDITEFKPKQANAIFLTKDPKFANTFADASIDYIVYETFQSLPFETQEKVIKDATKLAVDNGTLSKADAKFAVQSALTGGDLRKYGIQWHLKKFMRPYLTTGENIIPLFVNSVNPFDYENPAQVDALVTKLNGPKYNKFLKPEEAKYGDKNREYINTGSWKTIEAERVQDAIKDLGHDGFYVKESFNKNLAVYNPNQVKSAFNQKPTDSPDIRFSLRQPSAWYYSQLERGIEATPDRIFGKAPQVKAWLTSNASKMGVKSEELQFSGINDWLDLQGDKKVSKEEILNYLQQGGVRLEEVKKSEEKNETKYQDYQLDGGTNYQEMLITLPKLAVQVPSKWEVVKTNLNKEEYSLYSSTLKDYALGDDNRTVKVWKTAEEARDAIKDYAPTQDATQEPSEYRSPHWNERNILAHIRMDDRKDRNGSKVLFIEEIQSDWHQAGRKKGYEEPLPQNLSPSDLLWEYGPKLSPRQKNDLRDFIERYELSGVTQVIDEGLIPKAMQKEVMDFARKSLDDEYKAWLKGKNTETGIPNAPFKDTKAWTGLALKRIIAYAVENGYDKVAFINGEQSAERYNLSKQIDNIIYEKNDDGTYDISAYKEGRSVYSEEELKLDQVENTFGKEIVKKMEEGVDSSLTKEQAKEKIKEAISRWEAKAKRGELGVYEDGEIEKYVELMTDDPGGYTATLLDHGLTIQILDKYQGRGYRNKKELSGLDLKVGGKGMINYYDNILPQVANDVLKKIGGGNLEKVIVPVRVMVPANLQFTYSVVSDLANDNAYVTNVKTGERVTEPMNYDDAKDWLRANDPITSNPQTGFTITDKIREKVGEGIPLFSLRSQLSDSLNNRIGATTTKRKQAGFVERLMDAISPTAITAIRQGLVNKYESIELLSRLRGEQFGEDQLLAETSAIAAALQSDRAAGVAASSFRDGVPVFDKGYTYVSDMDGKVKGLIPILEPLMKYNDPYIFQTFQFYAGTRRGRRLDAEGREKTFTKEDIEAGKELEKQFPEFATVFDEYQKYNQGLVKYMMDTGVISPQEAKTWTENWDYIPFYRQIDGEKTAGPKVFSPIAGVAKPKKLKGSEAPLDDFMETIVRNARAAIEAGMKNEAARRVIRDVVDFDLGERLAGPQSGNDIVTVKENGMTVYYRVDDPLLVESLKGLNLPQLPFMSFLSAPADLLRNFVTKDPGFILANLGRDSMQAWITSGTDMKPLVDTFKQFGKGLLNYSPEAYALARSGLTGYDFAGDVESTAKKVEQELRKRTGTRTKGEVALLPITKFWDMLGEASTASDMATRAEVYKRTLERTGSEAEAFYQAMEVINFSRKGNSALIRILSATIPFFNARVQGLDVLYRTGFGKAAMANKDKIQKAFIFRSMVLLGTSVMYWAMVSDDEEYKRLSEEERDNYWIIPGLRIDDKPFRFPIPFELGVLFKVLPERALEYSFGSDTGKDLRKSLLRNAMSTLSFNPIPQAVLPIVENVTNYSFFTGEPVIGRGVQGLAPPYQFGAGTSVLAKQMGEALNYSPQKIDNLIRGYTGTLGTYAMMMLDSALEQEGDPPRAAKRMEQMPIIKRFFASNTGTVSAYYDLKEEVDTVVTTVNMLQRTGNSEDLKTYLEENKKLYGLKSYVATLDKNMKQLNQATRLINASKTMSSEEKREALDKINDAKIKLTERVKLLRKGYE